MAIAVAIKAGTIDQLSAWIGGNVSSGLVALMLGVVGAIISLFASTLGVVSLPGRGTMHFFCWGN